MLEVWVDGRMVPAGDAQVSVYDRGFRLGEGVFETLRAYGDHVFRRDQHLDRAVRGAAFLGFTLDHDELSEAVTTTARVNLAALGGRDSVLRLTATPGRLAADAPFPSRPLGGPTVVVTSHPLELDPRIHAEGVHAMPVPWVRELPDVKAVSHLAATVARAHAREHGADEALLTDAEGRILEGAGSNVFAVLDGVLVTPPADAGLLAGVTRQVVLELAPRARAEVEERAFTVADLRRADEAFLTATTRELMPLVRVAGAPIGDGRPGALTRRLHVRYREEVEREIAAALS